MLLRKLGKCRNSGTCIVFYFKVLAQQNSGFRSVQFQGLDSSADYELAGSGDVFDGDELMEVGLRVPEKLMNGDFTSHVRRMDARGGR